MKRMTARILRVFAPLIAATALTGTVVQAAPEGTTLYLTTPDTAASGDEVDLKAQLVSIAGAPIPGAVIFFSVPSTFFLGATSDVVLARVTTDKQGRAETRYQIRDAGQLAIRAEFRGDERYAPVKTVHPIAVEEGNTQFYVQEAGVRIPGLNSAPSLWFQSAPQESHGGSSTGLAALWPRMSFWPIGLVLAIVWSLYVYVVVQVFRIVRSAERLDGSRAGTYHGSQSVAQARRPKNRY